MKCPMLCNDRIMEKCWKSKGIDLNNDEKKQFDGSKALPKCQNAQYAFNTPKLEGRGPNI